MIVYLIRNNVNGKIYVGKEVTVKSYYYGSGKLIKAAIRKYGKDNFTKEVLEECSTLEELESREKYYIEHYKCRDVKVGYNIATGGTGGDTGKSWFKTMKVKDFLIAKYGEEEGISQWDQSILKKVIARKEREAKKEAYLRQHYRLNVITLWQQGHKVEDIYNELYPNISILYIRKFLKEYFKEVQTNGYKKSKNKGSSNANSKLSDTDVLEIRNNIRNLLDTKAMQLYKKHIRTAYNLSASTVNDLFKGKSYKHLVV